MRPVMPMSNQDPDISRVPFNSKNSTPTDFEAQIREIDNELERKVSKESLLAEGVLVSLAL